MSTQTEESPPPGASVKAATTSAGQYDAISGDDVTGKEGHSVVYKSTGAVPKTTKVKGAQLPPPQPSYSLVSKRPFLPPTTSTSNAAGSLNPEVKAPAEGQPHHRPLFVCNTGYPHYHPKGGLTTSASVKTKWKRRPKTQWEETAKTMLDMTVMYLRKLPQVNILLYTSHVKTRVFIGAKFLLSSFKVSLLLHKSISTLLLTVIEL